MSINPTTKELLGLGHYSGTSYDSFIINTKGGDTFPYHYDIICESSAIIAAIEKDSEGVYSQIKAEPDDLIWRHYFVQRALLSTQKSAPIKHKSEKIEKDILTADEAANLLRMSKKTLQNYASNGKVKSLKDGKFRRKDLDEYLSQKKKK